MNMDMDMDMRTGALTSRFKYAARAARTREKGGFMQSGIHGPDRSARSRLVCELVVRCICYAELHSPCWAVNSMWSYAAHVELHGLC